MIRAGDWPPILAIRLDLTPHRTFLWAGVCDDLEKPRTFGRLVAMADDDGHGHLLPLVQAYWTPETVFARILRRRPHSAHRKAAITAR